MGRSLSTRSAKGDSDWPLRKCSLGPSRNLPRGEGRLCEELKARLRYCVGGYEKREAAPLNPLTLFLGLQCVHLGDMFFVSDLSLPYMAVRQDPLIASSCETIIFGVFRPL